MAMTIESIHTSGFTSPCTSELFVGFKNDISNVTELASKLSQCPGFCEAVFKTGNLVGLSQKFVFYYSLRF